MIDQEQIILMSKLAALDKKYMRKDLRITKYYAEDYVYLNNMKTRMSILIMTIGCIVGHILLEVQHNISIPATGEELFRQYILPYGSGTIIILFLYTLLSTKVYTKKYREAEKRVSRYKELMGELEEVEKQKEEERRRVNGRRKTFDYENKVDKNL